VLDFVVDVSLFKLFIISENISFMVDMGYNKRTKSTIKYSGFSQNSQTKAETIKWVSITIK
jgi:hypothetical protein